MSNPEQINNTPEAPKVAVKTAAKTANKSIRTQPSDEELDERREAAAKKAADKEVKVKTASGGDMWDPEANLWIEGRPTVALNTTWLQRQIKAKKIIKLG